MRVRLRNTAIQPRLIQGWRSSLRSALVGITALVFFSIHAASCQSLMSTKHYVHTIGDDVYDVTDRVEKEGWKIVSDWKLINPRPLPLTTKDRQLLADSLPGHLAGSYPEDTATLRGIDWHAVAAKATYAFSIMDGLCDDVYVVRLGLHGKPVAVYFQKCFESDELPPDLAPPPLRDEMWSTGMDTHYMNK